MNLKNKLLEIIATHPNLDHKLHLMQEVEEYFSQSNYESVGESLVYWILNNYTDHELVEFTPEEQKEIANMVDGLTELDEVESVLNRYVMSIGYVYNEDEMVFERK